MATDALHLTPDLTPVQALTIRGLALVGGTFAAATDGLPPWARTLLTILGALMTVFGPTLALVAQSGLKTYLETKSRARAIQAAEDAGLKAALARLDQYEAMHGLLPSTAPKP